MGNFFTAEVIWFLIGLVLLLLELAVPGLVLFFFGAGAWITAGLCLFLPLGLNVQILIFLAASLLSLALLRKALRDRLYSNSVRGGPGDLEDDYVGHTVTALEDFNSHGEGRVSFKGSDWTALCATPVSRGQQLVITGFESIRLQVEPIRQPIL